MKYIHMKSKTALSIPDDDRNNKFELREIMIRIPKDRKCKIEILYMKGILYSDKSIN